MRLFCSVLTLLGLTMAWAVAADMPVKAPPARLVAAAWTGIYGGIQAGYAWGSAVKSDDMPFITERYDTKGWLAGVTFGQNWQNGSLVAGFETDIAYARIRGTTDGPAGLSAINCIGNFCESVVRALGTLRGRVGMAHGGVLGYVTGGLAYAYLYGREGNPPPPFGGDGSAWVAGWTVGAGVEAFIDANWSVKAEYLYVDLGKHPVFNLTLGGAAVAQRIETQMHVARLGLNRKFSGPLALP